MLYLLKCLLTVLQGASADSLSISLHLSLILTFLQLYNRKTTPQGTLFIHATMFTENTQRTSWRFESTRRAGELDQYPGRELRHKQHCHDFTFQLLPWALLKIEFITQLKGSRDNLSVCLHRVSPHHTRCSKTGHGHKQGDVMLGLSCKG